MTQIKRAKGLARISESAPGLRKRRAAGLWVSRSAGTTQNESREKLAQLADRLILERRRTQVQCRVRAAVGAEFLQGEWFRDHACGQVREPAAVARRDRGRRRTHESGQAIEESWGAKVYSTYGVTELANSLCECEAGQGGHLHDEQLHIEILDDAGQPVADGEVGEIVATTFGVEAMPLIRYRTGDCAAFLRTPCACGRTTPRLGPIIGRKNQKLKFKGTSLFPSMLAAVLEEAADVESFVIIARRESELSDSIEVLVHGTAPAAALREALQARAKIAPQIRHVTCEEIESWQMPPQARKRRTFVDLRAVSTDAAGGEK